MAKTDLNFKIKPPKLKHFKPEPTTISLSFTTKSKDLNPMFLQELSDLVRADYLIPLSETWADNWAKWDDELDKLLPGLAPLDKKYRKYFIDKAVAPYYKEYSKQTENIKKMAQSIGERYWKDIARKRDEITNEQLFVGAKVIWSGVGIASGLTSIITSGGTALASYVAIIKKIHNIYSTMKKYFAPVKEYHGKVLQGIADIRAGADLRQSCYGRGPEYFEDVVTKKKTLDKLVKSAKKDLSKLSSDLQTFSVKVNQLHRSAGEIAKELDKALNNIDAALGLDKKLLTQHESKIMSMIFDVNRIGAEAREFEKFQKRTEKFVKDMTKELYDEEAMLKTVAKAVKSGGTVAAKEIGTVLGIMSADIAASKALSKDGLSDKTFIKGWDERIQAGLKIGDALLKVF